MEKRSLWRKSVEVLKIGLRQGPGRGLGGGERGRQQGSGDTLIVSQTHRGRWRRWSAGYPMRKDTGRHVEGAVRSNI